MIRSIQTLVVVLAVTFIASSAQAAEGFLVEGARITMMGSVTQNSDAYWIVTTGGTGPCANQMIRFRLTNSPSAAAHQRGFQLLTAAFLAGRKIRVYTYFGLPFTNVDTTCATAVNADLLSD